MLPLGTCCQFLFFFLLILNLYPTVLGVMHMPTAPLLRGVGKAAT